MKPRIVSRASATALAAFGAIALLDEPTRLDWAVYDWARRAYRRPIDWAGRPLEAVGLPGAYIPLAVLTARRLRRRGRGGGGTIVTAAVAGWLTVRLMRVLVWRPRPPDPPRRRNATESTFPSGHTTGVTTLCVAAAKVLRDEQVLTTAQAAALGIAVPIIFAVNRVYVREHWLTDVLGGLALGTAAGTAVVAVSGPPSSRY
jgi:undecaprenyl-diphosphatase